MTWSYLTSSFPSEVVALPIFVQIASASMQTKATGALELCPPLSNYFCFVNVFLNLYEIDGEDDIKTLLSK